MKRTEPRLREHCMLIGRGYFVKTVKETEAGSICSGSTPGSWFSSRPSFVVGVYRSMVCYHCAVSCVNFFSLNSYLQFNFPMMVWPSQGISLY